MDDSMMKKADIASMCLMAIASATLVLSAVVDYESLRPGVKVMSYAVSALFWLSLLAAWLIKLLLYRQIKNKADISGKPAVITFFSNTFAKVADIALACTFLCTVISLFTSVSNVVKLIFISLFILAFQMHIALNGKVNKYIYQKRG